MTSEEILDFIRDPEAFKRIGTAPLAIRIGVVVILVALILAGGTWKFVLPKFDTIEELEREEQDLKQTFERQSRKAANLEAYQDQLAEMERSFGTMLRQLPNTTEVESLLVDLSQTSAANNLKVDHFRPTGETPKEFYAEYPINMRVSGKYHELAKFVSDVAALPRIVTLHNISIKPAGKDNGEQELVMEMIAKTYRYLDGA